MKTLFKKITTTTLILLIVIANFFSTGCIYTGYKGEYPDFCSVAWDNIPGLDGYASNGEVAYDPETSLLETDAYGRTLFSYSESSRIYVLIMQYSDEEKAYYYPDDCYISMPKEEGRLDVNAEEIVALKELNDWGKPIDQEKCQGTEIVRKKPTGQLKLSDGYFEKIIEEYHENSDRYVHPKNISFVRYYEFVTSDAYGRELYQVVTDFEEYTEKTETYYIFCFLVAVNPDMSYDPSTVLIIEDHQKPQKYMKQIKQENGWNTAF